MSKVQSSILSQNNYNNKYTEIQLIISIRDLRCFFLWSLVGGWYQNENKINPRCIAYNFIRKYDSIKILGNTNILMCLCSFLRSLTIIINYFHYTRVRQNDEYNHQSSMFPSPCPTALLNLLAHMSLFKINTLVNVLCTRVGKISFAMQETDLQDCIKHIA